VRLEASYLEETDHRPKPKTNRESGVFKMDAQLAAIYGTGVSAEEDQVKLAAAELLVKLAEDNGVDLSQFSDAEVVQMIEELHKTAEFPPAAEEKKDEKKESKETPEAKESKESSESAEKEAAEKVAEADFLGRVMAHSFEQERREITKEAKGLGEAAGKAWAGLKGVASKAKPHLERGKELVTGSHARDLKGADEIGKRLAPKSKETKVVSGMLKSEKNKVLATRLGLGAAGAAGVAGGVAAASGKKKESSALDAIASERAWELAKEAGWVDEEGNLLAPQQEEKVASPLELEIERRALQMLEAEGLPVQWNE
jgi:hypothetical protein